LRVERPVSPADILVSAGVFAAFLPYAHRHGHFPLAVTLGALNATVLLAKKRFPLLTLALCLALSCALAVLLRLDYPATPAVLVALYAVGRYRPRTVAVPATIGTILIGFVAAQLFKAIPSYNIHTVSQLGWVPFAVLAGAWVQTQRTQVTGAQLRAERAEHEREEVRHRATEERLRIAREVHDIIGHALMSINVTSSVAGRLDVGTPETSQDALRTVNAVSRSALQEIRNTLDLLSQGGEPSATLGLGLGLDELSTLIEQVRQSGMPVVLTESGHRPHIPAITGYSAYRIVQESLTNITRHARNVTEVTVAVTFTPEILDIAVTNDGARTETPDQTRVGIGIQGMRERAAAAGGYVDPAPLPKGGFRVHVQLPLKESRAV
jgi:signal transduction histidine kinase